MEIADIILRYVFITAVLVSWIIWYVTTDDE